MKKRIFGLAVLCLLSLSVFAQENNSKCRFSFVTGQFIGCQEASDFVIYEVPGKSASELKTSVYTALSTMYKSPKDVITSISDNMIQLEGYAKGLYRKFTDSASYNRDILFSIIIQFKDGKVRYNIPTIKQIYTEWPLSGMARLDMTKPLSVLIDDPTSRYKVEFYFNDLISAINKKLNETDNW